MLGFLRREPSDPPPDRPRCVRCSSATAVHYVGPGRYYCEPCLGRFQRAPNVPFDVVVDEWTTQISALQTAGELITVRLPRGFYSVCLLAGESALERAHRSVQRRPPTRRPQATDDHIDTADFGSSPTGRQRYLSRR